ncbi:MAG TPA: glucose 1-dehydrogenase [Thermomicrobiaceae bacterium]|nr:glucose 1-dehydrogenase [Thermomicrobiaceae bacterium]
MALAGDELRGKVALVTGAGSGIGRAIALRFAAEGATLALAGRTRATLEATASAIGAAALTVPLDVTDPASVASGVRAVGERLGPIDILVNNAGIGTTKSIVEVEPDEWERVFAVNVRGVYLCSRAVLPGMLERGSGSIVNIASALGLVGVPGRAAYAASKGAVIALTKQVAVEYAAQGIRCNCICPGTVSTEWVDRLLAESDEPEAARRALENRHPQHRLGTPEQVAAAALYLASEAAAFVTGSALVMDGGQSAR